MIKLKNIISHLDEGFYKTIEETLVKNKADNFLHLYRSYRSEDSDSEIIKQLNMNSNSYYVLKSRLYDKIQGHISGDINITREELIKKLDILPQMCFTEPREIVIPYLEKMESDLLKYDMHEELRTVYSILKKINLNTDKYFHYSQLYNKHIAFSLSIEKSEEILGNFNRMLGQYHFSRSKKVVDTLFFIKNEISVQYDLNPSRQVKIIKNIIELELYLFCSFNTNSISNIEELLRETNRIIAELPESSIYKYWVTPLDFLAFEYNFKIGQLEQAAKYYESVNSKLQNLLLFTNICCTPLFLISKIAFLQKTGRINEFIETDESLVFFEVNDTHAAVCYGIYDSMKDYYRGHLKEAINKLQFIINENSFKDFFHICAEIKFTLVFFYIQLKEFDLSLSLLKSIYRKIKSEKLDNYSNALSLIKILENESTKSETKLTQKKKDDFTLFKARNVDETELLRHLVFDLNHRYS